MDLSGVRLNCMPTDTKKQIPGLQPYRRFSTISTTPNKMVQYPFVQLTGHKVESPAIYLNAEPPTADKPNLFRNFSKSCHQLPFAISGFIDSRTRQNRESLPAWDNPIRRLGEFVTSNLLGTLCPDNPAFAYILSGGNNYNKKTAEPSVKQDAPSPTDDQNKLETSHSVTFNIAEHFLPDFKLASPSSPDHTLYPHHQTFPPCNSTPSPKPATVLQLADEPVILYAVVERPLSAQPAVTRPIPIIPTEHKSYAEVARMSKRRSGQAGRDATPSDARRYSKKADFFPHNRNKSQQRPADSSNWRYHGGDIKDVRRDKFVPGRSRATDAKTKEHKPPGDICRRDTKRHRKRSDRTRRPIVHEKHPNFDKNRDSDVESCVYYNPKEARCKNWRCRHRTRESPEVSAVSATSVSPKRFACKLAELAQDCCDTLSGVVSGKSLSSVVCSKSVSGDKSGTSVTSVANNRSSDKSGSSLSSDKSGSSLLSGRSWSECSADSEDSFVVFGEEVSDGTQDSDDEDGDLSSDWSECDTEMEDDVDACLSLLCLAEQFGSRQDEACMSPRLREVNRRWLIGENATSDAASNGNAKKVSFTTAAATVHPMVQWEYAYRTARCGPWEELARDRERFRLRVMRTEATLAAVLQGRHREKVWLRNQRLAEI